MSLISALSSLWIGIGVHATHHNMLNEREEIHRAIEQVDYFSENIMQPFDPILDRVNKPIEKKDKWAERLSNASFICFILAIVALSFVGFRQLAPKSLLDYFVLGCSLP